MGDFSYLIDKVKDSAFSEDPFKHIYIEDFLSEDHFSELIRCDEIAVPEAKSDRDLIDGLHEKGFKIINFPGCISDKEQYIAWHEGGKPMKHHSACEGFGMTLRLYEPKTPILVELREFLEGEAFNSAIAEKFGLDFHGCTTDGGIQKYLDGYEISPHPDIRRKAATFMVNINPSPMSEQADHHTHYLRFKPARSYVQSFWEGNPDIDRSWVPWDWTETVYQQTKNNSIVLFSPSNDTMHGVKARYDHLKTQRTQLYGNLWYAENPATSKLEWEGLDLVAHTAAQRSKLKELIRSFVPESAVNAIKNRKKTKSVGERTY